MDNSSHTNRLAQETSPYLLQHARNPVEWYPWSEESLARARQEDRPILLSIGYSACHWCHVMAHESFEDPATAALMNTLYVNIKVDREERPDLDKIYQLAHHLLTRRNGGWPLTMFLTPDLVPYFGGTYFPKVPRYGLPSFAEVLKGVAAHYREHRADIGTQGEQLVAAFRELEPVATDSNAEFSPAPLDIARNQLAHAYDKVNGGFGGAPKFPHPPHIERLLRHWAATAMRGQPDEGALHMAEHTLMKMADGGIYDQLGGGFCRYSVDERWMIPHFEKMLYDNGPLLSLYAQAWQITGNGLFRRVVDETASWVMREMQAPEGGYYSTLDADSEGEEGKYYVWDPAEVERVLGTEDYALFARRFGLDQPPNFEDHHWHLHVYQGLAALTQDFNLSRDEVLTRIDDARRHLLQTRDPRIHPGRDEKILTSWNGLMIKGMACAGRLLNEPRYITSAEHALDFIRAELWRDGRLLAVHKDGRARFTAYLDDYAFLLDGILELLQARWRDGDLNFAIQLADVMLAHYQDREHGGFYFTADDHETLIHRPKPTADEALPAGNGIAARVLIRLGHILGEPRYLEAAEHTLKTAWHAIGELPYAHDSLLAALEETLYPPQTVILRGPAHDLPPWQQRADRYYAPTRMTLAIPIDAKSLTGYFANKAASADAVTAYICTGTECLAPISDITTYTAELENSEIAGS